MCPSGLDKKYIDLVKYYCRLWGSISVKGKQIMGDQVVFADFYVETLKHRLNGLKLLWCWQSSFEPVKGPLTRYKSVTIFYPTSIIKQYPANSSWLEPVLLKNLSLCTQTEVIISIVSHVLILICTISWYMDHGTWMYHGWNMGFHVMLFQTWMEMYSIFIYLIACIVGANAKTVIDSNHSCLVLKCYSTDWILNTSRLQMITCSGWIWVNV